MFYSHDHCLVKTISAHEKTDIHMQINTETLKEEKSCAIRIEGINCVNHH